MLIRTKFSFIVIVFFIVSAIIVANIFYNNDRMNKLLSQKQLLDDCIMSIFEMNSLSNEYIYHKRERVIQQWQSNYKNLKQEIDLVFAGSEPSDPISRNIAEDIYKNYQLLGNSFQELNKKQSSHELYNSYISSLLLSSIDLTYLIFDYKKLILDKFVLVQKHQNLAVIYGLSLLLLMCLGAFWTFSRGVSRPLNKLTRLLPRIGSGDLGLKLPVEAQDEIGQLAQSFNDMTDNLAKVSASRDELNKEIEERKKAQKDVVNRERRFRSLIENAPDGIVINTAEGNIAYASPSALRLFGYSFEELTQENVGAKLTHPDDLPRVLETFEKVVQDPSFKPTIEYRFKSKSGDYRLIESTFSNLLSDPAINGFVLNFRDITESKKAEEEKEILFKKLQDSNQQLEHFAYAASHDLQEPLRKISSFSGLLVKHLESSLDEKALKYINYITSGTSRMQKLITDLLDFSRISTRAKPFTKLDMNEVIARAVDRLSLKLSETDADLTIAEMPEIFADGSQITSVVQNLLSNAIKFRADEPPKIKIDCRQETDHWLFSVADNGIGMDQQYQDRVFIIFQRLHSRDQYEGTGIGLAVCKKIVERHDGRIWFESEPAKGTTFYFTISKHLSEEK